MKTVSLILFLAVSLAAAAQDAPTGKGRVFCAFTMREACHPAKWMKQAQPKQDTAAVAAPVQRVVIVQIQAAPAPAAQTQIHGDTMDANGNDYQPQSDPNVNPQSLGAYARKLRNGK
jgi:hypothetical protein